MGLGEGSFDTGDSTKKSYQEGCRCAAALRTKPLDQGLAIKNKEYWLVDAVARAKHLGEVEHSYLDQFPWRI